MKCLRCKRGLKDPKSVERQYGPVCWGKVQAEQEKEEEGARSVHELLDGVTVPPIGHEPVTLKDLPERIDKEYVLSALTQVITVQRGEDEYVLPHIVYHSPTGFAWGYGGSGPADLARSILWDLAGQKVADTYYQSFKREFIAPGPRNAHTISGQAVLEWLRGKVGTEIREWSN